MLFSFPCSCGQFVLVDDQAGAQFFCPECGRIHDMPRRAVPAGGASTATPASSAVTTFTAPSPAGVGSLGAPPAGVEALPLPPVGGGVAETLLGAPTPHASAPASSAPAVSPVAGPNAHEFSIKAEAPLPVASAAPLPFATPIIAVPSPPSVRTLPVAELVEPLAPSVRFNPIDPKPVAMDPVAVPETPRIRLREDPALAWSRLMLGLGFFYGQFLSNLIVISILMIGINITTIIEETAQPRLIAFLLGITGLGIFLIGPALGITGSLLCCFVPRKVCSRVLPAWALAFNGAPMLFGLMFVMVLAIVGELIPALGAAVAAVMLGVLAMYGAWIFYLFFIKQLAEYLEMHICVDEANHYFIQSLPLMIAPICILVLAFLLAGVWIGPYLAFLMLTIWLIYNCKFMFGLLSLVSTLRQAIRTRERV